MGYSPNVLTLTLTKSLPTFIYILAELGIDLGMLGGANAAALDIASLAGSQQAGFGFDAGMGGAGLDGRCGFEYRKSINSNKFEDMFYVYTYEASSCIKDHLSMEI